METMPGIRVAVFYASTIGALSLVTPTAKADPMVTYDFTIPDNDNTSSQNSTNNNNFGGNYGCTTPGNTHECWLGNTYTPTVQPNPFSPYPTNGIYGQVTLTLGTANCGTAANCIQVAISMATGFDFGGPFPDSGAGPPAAAFALNDSTTIVALGLPTGWSLTTGAALDDPFGQFSAYLSGPAVQNGTLTNTVQNLTFYVANSNGSAFSNVNQLVKSNNNWPSPCGGNSQPACDGFYFAVHAYARNTSGYFDSQVGAITPAGNNGGTSNVPEPNSLILSALLLGGLQGIATWHRRKAG